VSYWVDTHAHIYSDDFEKDREEMLVPQREPASTKIYMPNVDQTTVDGMLGVEAAILVPALRIGGLHPCSVKKDFDKELYTGAMAFEADFAAVGEIRYRSLLVQSHFGSNKKRRHNSGGVGEEVSATRCHPLSPVDGRDDALVEAPAWQRSPEFSIASLVI